MASLIYPKILTNYIKDHNCIPKKVKFITDLRQYSRYVYLEQFNPFKIENIIQTDDYMYFQVRYLDSNRQAVIPYDEKNHYYELLMDRSDIKHLDSIININDYYYGSEIKYWFYIHKINLDSKKYQIFRPYILGSDKTLSDRKIYRIKATYIKELDEYVDCQIDSYKINLIKENHV